MAQNVYKGRDFDFTLDSSLVGSGNKCSISVDRDMLEIVTYASSRGKEYIPDMYTYNVSADGVLLKSEAAGHKAGREMLNKLVNSDSSVAWSARMDGSTNDYYSGWGFLKSYSSDLAVGDKASYSIQIQGCGDIAINMTV